MFDSMVWLGQVFQSWYEGLPNGQAIIFLFVCLAGCFVVLTKAAGLLVDGAAGLAANLGVPKIIIGATVVSLGTTLPEASASVMASLAGDGGIAAGNAVGSIICNAGLVFGLCCTMVRLPVSRFTLNRNAWFQIGGAGLLVVLYLLSAPSGVDDGTRVFGRTFGIILLMGLSAYTVMSIRWGRQSVTANGQAHGHAGGKLGKPVLLTAIGFVLVITAAKGLLLVVTELSLKLGVPADVVSVTLLALGTSIPEFATGLMSLIKGHRELLVGNVIGANILNIFFVFGLSATVRPLVLPDRFLWLNLPVMMVILVLFHLNIWTSRERFSRWPSLIMLIIYSGFVVGVYLLSYQLA